MTNPQAPGGDELRVRSLLIMNGVGPDAGTPGPIPPKPTTRPRDWLDDILDANTAPTKANPRRTPKKQTAPEQEKPAPEPDEDEETEEDDDPEKATPPAWDPVAIADRIARAYRDRPVGERLRDAAEVVVNSRARVGQLFFTASGVWVAWRFGFTPWLMRFTADAPVGIPVLAFGLGWGLNRRLDATALFFVWIGRAIYTATLINLVLHP